MILCEFERGTGAREIYPSLDQVNRVRSKDSKGFFGRKQVISRKKKVFTEIARDFPPEVANSSSFYGRKQVISEKKKIFTETARDFPPRNRKFKQFFRPKTGDLQKKRSSSQIRCQSTKNTNLGLDLHSSSPDPVNSSGRSPRLGGHSFRLGGTGSHLGGHGPGMPPRGAGSEIIPLYD